jgi:hypothetical protein
VLVPPRTPLALLCVLLLAVGFGACSSDDDADDAGRPEPGVTGTAVERPDIDLRLTGADLVSPHQAFGPLPDAHRDRALATVQAVFDATVVAPLVLREERSVAGLFTPDAARLATGQDRAALFDDDLPPVSGLTAEKANVRLTGLAGTLSNDPDIVVAKIDWDVHSPDDDVRVRRRGELGLIPGGARGWQVASYTVTTTRTTAASTTSTTATTETEGVDQ